MKNMKYCPYKEAKYALSGTADKFDAVAILDIDGVVNSINDLKFQELPINALTVLQESFREINLLTGRYANLFANEGVQKFIECGFDFEKPFRYFAEMGGVEICLVEEGEIYKPGTKELTPERRRMLEILANDYDKSVVECREDILYWVAKLHAPEITVEARNLIWQAAKFAIAKQIANGSLEKFGIMSNESAELWSERLYNREVENLTKGTVTTSRVPKKYADLAYNVNLEIGGTVADEINEALKDYNDGRATKLEAIHHPDAGCVEVLFEGTSKFNTTKSIIEQMDARAGHKVKNVITFGDSYTDIAMAQAAVSLNRHTIHFHLGGYEEFMSVFDKEKGLKPDHVIYFPEFNMMFKNNRILASATISAAAMWELIGYLQKSPSSWETVLNEYRRHDVAKEELASELAGL